MSRLFLKVHSPLIHYVDDSPYKACSFNTSDSSLFTKEAHIQSSVSLWFFCKNCNHLFKGVSGCHSITPRAGQCFIIRIRWGLSPVRDLLISLTILIPSWKAFKTASCVAYLKAGGLWQECGLIPLVLQNHFLCSESCFSPASYRLVSRLFFLWFWFVSMYLMAFISFIPFPSFTQTVKKGMIMRCFCICLPCQAV